MPARVLVVYGSESGTCKRLAGAMAKEWAARAEGAFEISRVCDGAALIQDMSVMEDDNNRIHSDFSSLRSKYDVLLLLTSSYGEGDPPENFGAFFLGLLAAAASGSTPLAGMQHSVFGQGSTVYQETFQNMPRLTDRFLGECGSRRFVMPQEVDAAHYIDGEQHVVDGNHWRETVLETLRAMPKASAPAVCGWETARASHGLSTDKVTPKSADDLVAFRGRVGPSGATNEQAIGMFFWAAVLWAFVAYGLFYAGTGAS